MQISEVERNHLHAINQALIHPQPLKGRCCCSHVKNIFKIHFWLYKAPLNAFKLTVSEQVVVVEDLDGQLFKNVSP